MNGKQLIQLLQKNGWVLDHITGSHRVMRKENKKISVPVHGKKDISKGTLHTIMKQGGLK